MTQPVYFCSGMPSALNSPIETSPDKHPVFQRQENEQLQALRRISPMILQLVKYKDYQVRSTRHLLMKNRI